MTTPQESLETPIELVVPEQFAGARLDWFLARQFTSHSRVHLRRAINAAAVRVNGKRAKAALRLVGGEQISIVLPDAPREGPRPENIPLEILYEDPFLAIVNKPPGMVVHPARGHWSGTLASALQFHFDQLSTSGGPTRPGIVHRLDRDTSGALLVAKTDQIHMQLADQFERRTVEKEYWAVVAGAPESDRDVVEQPIGPHPYQREKMAVRHDHPQSRPARTFFEVLERFDGFSLLKVIPKTGRTHQIRLHLAHLGCPVLCDRLYGGRSQLTLGELRRARAGDARGEEESRAGAADEVVLRRQALHAARLKFVHPCTEAALEVFAPLPADLARLVDALRTDRPKLAVKKSRLR